MQAFKLGQVALGARDKERFVFLITVVASIWILALIHSSVRVITVVTVVVVIAARCLVPRGGLLVAIRPLVVLLLVLVTTALLPLLFGHLGVRRPLV